MASRRTDQHRRELGLIAGLTARDVRAEARRADTSDIDGWWQGGAGARISDIVASGFRATAVLGVEYLAASALAEGIAIEPVLAAVDLAQLATSLRVTGPVAFKVNMRRSGSPAAALRVMETRLGGSAQRLALAGERETVMEAVRTSPAIIGYRRVTAAGACKFCEMLAGRGAVYTRESATAVVGRRGQTRGTRSIGEPYHDSCRCSSAPIWADAPVDGGGPPSSPPTVRRVGLPSSSEPSEEVLAGLLDDLRRQEADRSRLLRSEGAARARVVEPRLDRESLSEVAARRSATRRELEDLIAREGDAVERLNRSGAQGTTEIVVLPDGRRLVVKRATEEGSSVAGGVGGRVELDKEELGSLLAQAVGVETPVMVRTDPLVLKMEYVDGVLGDALSTVEAQALYESDAGRLTGVLDALLGNRDRHGGNWFARDGLPVAFDHGMAWRYDEQMDGWVGVQGSGFANGQGLDGPIANIYGGISPTNDLSPADVELMRERIEALAPDFERLGHRDWFDHTMEVFEQIAAAASGDRNRLVP